MRTWIWAFFALGIGASTASAQRLPSTVVPERYDLTFAIDLGRATFDGTTTIRVQVAGPTTRLVLNALDLDMHEATVSAGGATQTAEVAIDRSTQTATLKVPAAIGPGDASIRIRYSAALNDQLRGLYLSKGRTRNYAVTQFESTDARRAFPCFDEPALKATFSVTVVAPRGDMVISNGRVASDTPGPGPSQHTVRFTPSPRMSTYLVAIAVGDFRCLEGSADQIPIRICATPDKAELGRIALESAQQILTFYNAYYAIKYPFGKLDILAVPDFAAGAMENTAAIFYRETDLLAATATSSVDTRKNIASVLAHEMAHQWFGDLVTMQWWDDLWLNEGFATWMANRPLEAMKPEWNIPVEEALETQTALNVDALKATRPLHAAAETPEQIEELFDAIAYQKGAAVLRMIEAFVGRDVFRKGVNTYLQRHVYGNATSSDFWNAIAAASGRPIEQIMATFVSQPGFPLIDVSVQCLGAYFYDHTQVTLTQQRFAIGPELPTPAQTWTVPVCVKASGQFDTACDVIREPKGQIPVGVAGCAGFAFANAGATGYYRTAYPTEMLRAMAPRVNEFLTPPERLTLVSDQWALVRAGRVSAADYLTLASGFGREHVAGVLAVITDRLRNISVDLTTADTRPTFEQFVRVLLGPLYAELGFSGEVPPGDDNRQALRSLVISALGVAGNDPDIAVKARHAVDRALAGGPPLEPTSAGMLVTIAARHGDAKLFDALVAAADRAVSPEDHYRYLYALASFRDPVLFDRGVARVLTPEIRNQDAAIYLTRFLANPDRHDRAWAFVKAHWDDLASKLSISGGDVNLVASLSSFCTAEARVDLQTFFDAHPLPGATRTLTQTFERIDACTALRQKETPRVTEWLGSRESGVGSR